MSVSTTDLNTVSPQTSATSPATTDAANGALTTTAADGSQVKLTPAIAKQQLNESILKASLEVSISSQNDPLALVYKSAIENLNDILKPELGDNAIQKASTQDNSPEATAGRILSFIKSAYAMYSQNNKDDDQGASLDKFMSLIQTGVDLGFKEARNILSGLDVLNGDIASNIDKTYELLKKGMADFVDSIKNPPADDGSTPDSGDGTGSSTTTTVSVSISVTATQTEVTSS